MEKRTIKLTETTIKSLMGAIELAHRHNYKTVVVGSSYHPDEFEISVEVKPHTQESLGYSVIKSIHDHE